MSSKQQYNNDQWHTVIISRQQSKGKLLIDGDDEAQGESSGNTRVMSLQGPYSFGGVNASLLEYVAANTGLDKSAHFFGCIRNIQVAARPWGEPDKVLGAIPCSEQIESGAFFSGGYVKVNTDIIL